MLPILQVGPLALPLPALLLLAGFWIGLELTEKHAPRFGADPTQIYHTVLAGLLAGVIGARLSYALQAPGAFAASPLSLLALRPQMLDAQGGLLVAALAAFIYGQRRGLPLWPSLDALTSLFAVMMTAIGLANLASGDGFGAPTSLPWAITLWGAERHPTQVYEAFAALLIAAATWPGSVFTRDSEASGQRFWIFVILTALSQVFLQGLRGDSVLVAGLRAAQLVAWVVLATGLWQVGRRMQQKRGEHGA